MGIQMFSHQNQLLSVFSMYAMLSKEREFNLFLTY